MSKVETDKSQSEVKEELEKIDLGNIDITKLPITTNAFSWTPIAIILNLILHVLSLIFPSVFVLTFYSTAINYSIREYWWRILIILVDVMAWWGLYILSALVFGKLFLIILKLIHKPKEGLFKIDKTDRDYYFFCLRISIKKFIFWIWNNFSFPWASNLAFKVCDMKADFKSTMFDGWSDLEFIEYGQNIMLGQGGVVLSSMVIGEHLLVKRVIIGDHVVIGGNAIVAPGTIIGKGATLGVWATTHIGQYLEPDWIYIGRPARKYKHAKQNLEDSKKKVVRRIVDSGDRKEFPVRRYVKKDIVDQAIGELDEMYQKWYESEQKAIEKRKQKRRNRK